jgi:hypothetical protein
MGPQNTQNTQIECDVTSFVMSGMTDGPMCRICVFSGSNILVSWPQIFGGQE